MDRPGFPNQLAVSPVRVGFWVDTLYNHLFNGGLAEIAVYPSALSADQLARHYTAAG